MTSIQEAGQPQTSSFLPQPLILRKILYRSSVKGSHRNKLQFSQAEQIAMLHQMTGGQLYQGGPSTDLTIRAKFSNTQVKGRAYFQANGRVVVDVCELMKDLNTSQGDIIVFQSTDKPSVLDVYFIQAKCEVCGQNNDDQILVQCSGTNCAKAFHPECFPNNQVCPMKCPYCNVGRLNVLDRQGLVSNTSIITLQTLYQNLNLSGEFQNQQQLSQVAKKRNIQEIEQQQEQKPVQNQQSINAFILNGVNSVVDQQQHKKIKTVKNGIKQQQQQKQEANQQYICQLKNNSRGPRLPRRRVVTVENKQEVVKQVKLLGEQIRISTIALKEAQTSLDSVLGALEDSQFLITQFCADNQLDLSP